MNNLKKSNMKMDFIIKTLSVVMLVSLSSCMKWLEEKPKSNLSELDVYANETSAKSAITGIYGNLAGSQYGAFSRITLGNNSIIMTPGPQGTLMGTLTPDTDWWNNAFMSLYRSINDCNTVLIQIKKSSLDQKAVDHIYGEALFLRAFFYFDVVRFWGRTPMPLTPAVTLEDTYRPREAIRTILEQIVKDFEEAFLLMPDKDEQTKGRPHKWAAKAMLAKVYTYMACIQPEHFRINDTEWDTPYTSQEQQGFWEVAYHNAKEVYESERYSLVVCYEDLFFNKVTSRNTDESIFELQFGTASSVTSNAITTRQIAATTEFCPYNGTSNWPNSSQQKPGPLVFIRHWNRHGQRDSDGNIIPIRTAFATTNPDRSNKMRDVDPRMNIGLIYYSQRQIANDENGNFKNYTNQNIFPHPGLGASWLWLFTKKYYYPEFNGRGVTNIYYYRYADLLLVLAEAANELGYTDEAIDYVDEVLARAKRYREGGMMYSASDDQWTSGTTPKAYGNIYSDPYATIVDDPNDERPPFLMKNRKMEDMLNIQDTLRIRIMEERIFELCNESGEEGFDLRRRGFDYIKDIFDRHHAIRNWLNAPVAEGGWGANATGLAEYDTDDELFMYRVLYHPIPRREFTNNFAFGPNDQTYGY